MRIIAFSSEVVDICDDFTYALKSSRCDFELVHQVNDSVIGHCCSAAKKALPEERVESILYINKDKPACAATGSAYMLKQKHRVNRKVATAVRYTTELSIVK